MGMLGGEEKELVTLGEPDKAAPVQIQIEERFKVISSLFSALSPALADPRSK